MDQSNLLRRQWVLYFICIGILLLLSEKPSYAIGTSDKGMGDVVFLITDHREAIDDFKSLWVTVDGFRLHRRDAPSDSGWILIKIDSRKADLTRYKDGSTLQLSREPIPVGWYDATELLLSAARGTLRSGDEIDVPLELSPVRKDIRIRTNQVIELTYDLVVHDLSDHGKTWGVLIREVRTHRVSTKS